MRGFVTRIGLLSVIQIHLRGAYPKTYGPPSVGPGFLRRSALANEFAPRPLRKKPSAYAEGFRDPDWIQTNDRLLRRQELYSAELPGQYLPEGYHPPEGAPAEMAAKLKKNQLGTKLWMIFPNLKGYPSIYIKNSLFRGGGAAVLLFF